MKDIYLVTGSDGITVQTAWLNKDLAEEQAHKTTQEMLEIDGIEEDEALHGVIAFSIQDSTEFLILKNKELDVDQNYYDINVGPAIDRIESELHHIMKMIDLPKDQALAVIVDIILNRG